jgi:hypothetical protein
MLTAGENIFWINKGLITCPCSILRIKYGVPMTQEEFYMQSEVKRHIEIQLPMYPEQLLAERVEKEEQRH